MELGTSYDARALLQMKNFLIHMERLNHNGEEKWTDKQADEAEIPHASETREEQKQHGQVSALSDEKGPEEIVHETDQHRPGHDEDEGADEFTLRQEMDGDRAPDQGRSANWK